MALGMLSKATIIVVFTAFFIFSAILSHTVVADPPFNPDNFFINILEQKTEIDRGYVIYEFRNPTDSPIIIKAPQVDSDFVLGKKGKQVKKRFLEILGMENVTITKTIPTFEVRQYENGSSYSAVNGSITVSETSEESKWLSEKTIYPNETVSIKETLYWPAGYHQSVDWQPYVNVSGLKVKQTKWAWFNASYVKGLQVYVNETHGRSWTNLALWFRGINLSGISHNGNELVFVNQSCNGGGGVQWPLSYSSSLEGKNSANSYNFSILVNLSAWQNFTGCLYFGNMTPTGIPSSRVRVVQDTFNDSSLTSARFDYVTYSGSSVSVTGGELVLTAAGNTNYWSSPTINNARFYSKLNFTRGFTVQCENKWSVGSSMGYALHCGAMSADEHGGYDLARMVSGVGVYKGGVPGAVRTGQTGECDNYCLNNWDAIHSNYKNVSIYLNSTADVPTGTYGYNGSFISRSFTTPPGQMRNKAGVLGNVMAVGDSSTINVKWMCAVDINGTCIAEDQPITKYTATSFSIDDMGRRNITFNVTSNSDDRSLNNVNIACSYPLFDQAGDSTNFYGPFEFANGTWNCTFTHPDHNNQSNIFTADNDKIVSINMINPNVINVTDCGIIGSPGKIYRLRNNINGDNCLSLSSYDYSVDLNQFTISGSPAIFGGPDCDHIDIKNGNIISIFDAITIDGSGIKCRIINLTIISNGQSIYFGNSLSNSLIENSIIQNSSIAISLGGDPAFNVFIKNVTIITDKTDSFAFEVSGYNPTYYLENSRIINFTTSFSITPSTYQDWFIRNTEINLTNVAGVNSGVIVRFFKQNLIKINVTNQTGHGLASSIEILDSEQFDRADSQSVLYTRRSVNPTGKIITGIDNNGLLELYLTERLIFINSTRITDSTFYPYNITVRSGGKLNSTSGIIPVSGLVLNFTIPTS